MKKVITAVVAAAGIASLAGAAPASAHYSLVPHNHVFVEWHSEIDLNVATSRTRWANVDQDRSSPFKRTRHIYIPDGCLVSVKDHTTGRSWWLGPGATGDRFNVFPLNGHSFGLSADC